jgi:hypothetical protein
VPGVDYVTFRLFLLSILWRMGESSLDAFDQVRLGPHAERLRRMLRTNNPGLPHEYPCLIKAIRHQRDVFRKTIIAPYRVRQSGLTAYRLAFAGFFWTFWVASHLSDAAVGGSVLREDGLLPIHPMKDEHVEKFLRDIAESMPD